jgi:Ca-activated chloride channel family protein
MASRAGRKLVSSLPPGPCGRSSWVRCTRAICLLGVAALVLLCSAGAQDDPLNRVHITPPPPPPPTPDANLPNAKDAMAAGSLHSGMRIRVDTNLVLVPLTVTDPLDRLVTGLDKENFFIYENNRQENIKSFSSEDAPVSIGIIFDLSGSMSNKVIRARDSILQFMKTANPQDEFFVIGFNDRPELIEDFTSSVDEIEARLATVHAGNRTALLDAIYFGIEKMKQAKYERRALLIVSDGGDNRSRYTEGEVRAAVREADTQIYSIGIFDPYAATVEERNGPLLLTDISDETGGNEYVIGYRTDDEKRDGKWRKLKVRLVPPPGLPQLTVHARTGYYAPLQ